MNAQMLLLLSLFWPQPRQVTPAPALPLRLPVRVEAPASLAQPAKLLRREVERLFGPGAAAAGGKSAFQLALAPGALPRPEEYALETGSGGVRLRAHDAQGAFWAVHSLVQLLEAARRTPQGYTVPGAKLRDWPESGFRAFMIQGAWTPNGEDFKRNLDLLARMKVKYFALEFGPQVIPDLDPGIAQGGKFTKAQARALIDYGRSLGMQPIAYLNLLGHLERAYKKEPYTGHGGLMIQDDATYEKFIYPLLQEMLDVYGPVEYFHCGMDEAWDLFPWLNAQGEDGTALLVRHIQRVNDFLKARGVKLVIWHDMFIAPELKQELGAPVGPANGGAPRNTAAALKLLPRDVILNYWFYDPLLNYPALDYLKAQGFTVWASPWQTPFSLVRYAQARDVPTMGTLWSGPPGCFYSPTYGPVTALYAQAAWNPAAAPAGRNPEPALAAAAQQATGAVFWGRESRAFPGSRALLFSPAPPEKRVPLKWPAQAGRAPAQHAGVPFDFGHPAHLEPLPSQGKPLSADSAPAYVLLPGNARLVLDGCNTARGVDQCILYTAPRASTGANIFGVEVTVSATGEVLEISDYGSGDHAIPAGGFVLSAHLGPTSAKGKRLLGLRPGDRIAVFAADDAWLGGYDPTRLWAVLPDGTRLPVAGINQERTAGALVVYRPGYREGYTGTNASGVEALVEGGKVTAVQAGVGNAAIPAAGYVLSAHQDAAAALRRLQAGDMVRLVLEKGGKEFDLDQLLTGRQYTLPVRAQCGTLFLALSTARSTTPGALLATGRVRYADGKTETFPIRYALEALPEKIAEWPHALAGNAWVAPATAAHPRCLVYEWRNPRPGARIETLTFAPEPFVLEVGLNVLAVTAASGK